MAFLIVINILTSPGYYWFVWPLFGWGIGLTMHAFSVWGKHAFFGKKWEKRRLEKLMRED